MEEFLKRHTSPIRMRNYGRILQDMVAYTCTVEDKEEQETLLVYIAQSMRQKNMVWNKDQDASLGRIKEDIITLSDGKLNCDFPAFEQVFTAPVYASNNNAQNNMPYKGKKNKKK